VSLVSPVFELRMDPREVASTFEIALTRVLDASQHVLKPRPIGATMVYFYEFTHDRYTIWGATAGMLMTLYRLLGDPVLES